MPSSSCISQQSRDYSTPNPQFQHTHEYLFADRKSPQLVCQILDESGPFLEPRTPQHHSTLARVRNDELTYSQMGYHQPKPSDSVQSLRNTHYHDPDRSKALEVKP